MHDIIIPLLANTFNVRFACMSTCQTAVAKCSLILTSVGKASNIPQCDQPIPDSASYAPPGIGYQPEGSCNSGIHLLTSGSSGSSNVTVACDAPFVADPMPGGVTANDQFCMYGCCLPCPAQYHLYREGALEIGFKITNTIRAVSMVLGFLLMMTYLCLDDKRSHPSALILFFSIGIFLFSVVVVFPLVDTRSMQCADLINPSTQQNNLKCAIQGKKRKEKKGKRKNPES